MTVKEDRPPVTGAEKRESFIPFALPDIGGEEIAEVVDSLRNGWLTTGPKTRRFEEDFAAFMGGSVQSLAVNSATSGLHLALEALGIGPGDEVIVPAYTFTATAEVIRYLGADPVFVEIDPDTLTIDPGAIETAVTSRTKAVIPVHFGGLAADMPRILAIARSHGLMVIEDAAHALPATSGGDLVGTLASDAAVFSFYATKTITTGEGGMVVTRDERLASRCRIMRLHGIDRDAFNRYTSRAPSWYYEIVAPGYKYNMTDIAAAIGIHQLKKAYKFQKRREEISRIYDDILHDRAVTLPPHAPERALHSWHLYVIRLKNDTSVARDVFIERMSGRGIGTSVHFIPLCIQPFWKERYHLREEDFPRTIDAYRRAVSLPIYTRMTDDDAVYVAESARAILGG